MDKRKFLFIGSAVLIPALILGGISYYQAIHFNAHITINDTDVSGLTADQALAKLEASVLKNEVYVGKDRVLDEADTKAGFSNEDLPRVEKLLKSQWTFFPSSKAASYSLEPGKEDAAHGRAMKQLLADKLTAMNQSLTAPKDAQARLEQGKVIIAESVKGTQYDVPALLKEFEKQGARSEVHLDAKYIEPLAADSPAVKKEESMLQELAQRTVEYKVQDKIYSLQASELIPNATVSKDMKYQIDPAVIKNKISEINAAQSTLNKNFTFQTHTGAVVAVKGQSYGWSLDVAKEAVLLQQAFEKGDKSLAATNIYGAGYNRKGVGYQTTANNGIGTTYAEVSIAEQRAWFYKNGQLVFTTNVVTGRHNTGEDTPTGVWYVMYKESPSILEGSSVGHPNYSVKVNFWAPFTNSGCGFHDASWRTNWASTAYLTQGSAGCVNTPPGVMQTVYQNLSQNEPVVIY
ncbi:L,D-transpeptidase family protein [Ectobacillus ponti]|uniref:L,D-transpeptidase/peptidoglycan binding protein n=1 Tax=Ectobacillus ponti TaxID=2961894 RepID=A0AA41X5S9_9BACI|nr:L,D-transpeptidase family protein [Ectobacillus ponti]MCP8969302.1 L,D-transpeptidase/peptidoglycan binding protein [Ectobacillus ponti]